MTTYTIDLSQHESPQAAGAALASMVNTTRAAKQYLDDVNDSAHYPARVLIELVADAFALSDAEARQIYREWAREVE